MDERAGHTRPYIRVPSFALRNMARRSYVASHKDRWREQAMIGGRTAECESGVSARLPL